MIKLTVVIKRNKRWDQQQHGQVEVCLSRRFAVTLLIVQIALAMQVDHKILYLVLK